MRVVIILLICFLQGCNLIEQEPPQEIPLSNPMFLWYNRPAIIESKFLEGKSIVGYVDNDKRVQMLTLMGLIKEEYLYATLIMLHKHGLMK